MEEFGHGSWGNEDDDVEEVPGPLAMVVFHEGVVDVDKEVTAAPEVSTYIVPSNLCLLVFGGWEGFRGMGKQEEEEMLRGELFVFCLSGFA